MQSVSPTLDGVVLIAAGLFQWTKLKDTCLTQCQFPLLFIQRHGGFRGTWHGSSKIGLRHGAYCVGCCWALMAVLFVAGIMNVAWIAVLAVFVLVERLVPAGRALSRIAGIALVAAGAWRLIA